jgi:hypothetical protein
METEDEKNYLETLSDALALKLGHAIWSFARIEWLTYEYIEVLANDDLLSLVGDQNFGQRIGILKKLVLRTEAIPELIEASNDTARQGNATLWPQEHDRS